MLEDRIADCFRITKRNSNFLVGRIQGTGAHAAMYPGPVVSAVVHKDFALPRNRTRCIDSVGIGLATGIREPHHFERWKALGHDGCCSRLVVVRAATQRMTGSHGFDYRLNNWLGRVTKKSGCKVA